MAGTTSLYGEHEEDMPGKILQIPLVKISVKKIAYKIG